jgi:hypothetical protein
MSQDQASSSLVTDCKEGTSHKAIDVNSDRGVNYHEWNQKNLPLALVLPNLLYSIST